MNDFENKIKVFGHVLITDKNTGEVLVDNDNAIHFGNMAWIVARCLANDPAGHINFMAFGNGATSIDPSGKIIYRAPNTQLVRDPSADLYFRTFNKIVDDTNPLNTDPESNRIDVLPSEVNFTDLRVTATLGFGEPAGQEAFDTALDLEGDFVFDELGLFSFGTSPSEGVMLTHVIFHPVQKSLNRVIEIVYTLRIQIV